MLTEYRVLSVEPGACSKLLVGFKCSNRGQCSDLRPGHCVTWFKMPSVRNDQDKRFECSTWFMHLITGGF